MNLYDKRYQDEKYYWGKEPSSLCKLCLEHCVWQVSSPADLLAGADEGVYRPQDKSAMQAPDKPASLVQIKPAMQALINQAVLVELGCGEGRDAIAFAKLGFNVTAVDLAKSGLDKTDKLAKEMGVTVETVLGNVIDYEIIKPVDVLFSTGAMQYLPKEIRTERFNHFKKMTKPGGYNAIAAFVEKPFIAKAPDAEDHAWFFKTGEIAGFYWDWEIIYSVEEIFECNSSGILHKHAISRMIAKKV